MTILCGYPDFDGEKVAEERSSVGFSRSVHGGFSLIELMVVMAVVAVLASIAFPAYQDYVTRSGLVDATNALSVMRVRMEQYYQDNRSYQSTGGFTAPCLNTSYQTSGSFTLSCTVSTDSYTITATGSGATQGFIYTIDQNGIQATTGLRSGWGTAPQTGCWVQRKGQRC